MGCRRLPRKEALATALMAVIVGLAGAACSGGSATTRPSATVVASATASSPSPTATRARPMPTPDALKSPPSNADEARAGLEAALNVPGAAACPQSLQTRWGVTCAAGDLDADGKPDAAYLVPLTIPASAAPNPAVVFVRLAVDGRFAPFTLDADADSSAIGRKFFAIEDRALGTAPELSFFTTGCTTTVCSTRAHIESWDGTSWRDIGPNDAGTVDLTSITFEGSGSTSLLTTQGGVVKAPGAGPTRATTTVYQFDGTRYAMLSQAFEKPVYVFEAILDADAKFDKGNFAAAIAGYQDAIANNALKDWKKKPPGQTAVPPSRATPCFASPFPPPGTVATPIQRSMPSSPTQQTSSSHSRLMSSGAVSARTGRCMPAAPSSPLTCKRRATLRISRSTSMTPSFTAMRTPRRPFAISARSSTGMGMSLPPRSCGGNTGREG